MFGQGRRPERLEPAPLAEENPAAAEILTLWAAPGSLQQLALQTMWEDPGA